MKYLIEKETGRIIKGEVFGQVFYDWIEIIKPEIKNSKTGEIEQDAEYLEHISDWRLCIQEEINVFELQEEKHIKLHSRKSYREKMIKEWWDDIENMPTEVKNKLENAKSEIIEIKNATIENINNYSVEF